MRKRAYVKIQANGRVALVADEMALVQVKH